MHSPAAGGLAQALNHAPRPDKPKHHNAQDAVGKLERALAAYEARDEIEHEPGTILIRHSPGFAKFAALCLGALALVGLGLAAGWVLRDKTATRDAAPAASTQLPPTTPPYAGTLPPAGTAGTRRGAASRVKGRTRVKRRRKRRARSRANLRRARRARAAAATAKTVKPSKVERKPSSNRGLMIVQAAQPADVLVNDRKRGQTPLRLELEGGIYRVKVVFSDNTTSTVRWIAVENGKEARVNFGSPETR